MSVEALNATFGKVGEHAPGVLAELYDRLQEVPEKRRPSYEKTALVAAFLADRHRSHRGYVDESVGQIAVAIRMKDSSVQTALNALDHLAIWVAAGRGNQHSATRRVPMFLAEHRGANPTEQNEQHEGADPTEQAKELDGVAAELDGVAAELDGADPTTPLSSPVLSPKGEREGRAPAEPGAALDTLTAFAESSPHPIIVSTLLPHAERLIADGWSQAEVYALLDERLSESNGKNPTAFVATALKRTVEADNLPAWVRLCRIVAEAEKLVYDQDQGLDDLPQEDEATHRLDAICDELWHTGNTIELDAVRLDPTRAAELIENTQRLISLLPELRGKPADTGPCKQCQGSGWVRVGDDMGACAICADGKRNAQRHGAAVA